MSDAEKPELRRANDNPWYCLATLHGEQPAQREGWKLCLAAKNRRSWNRWIARVLSDEQRALLVAKGVSKLDLVPITPTEEEAFRAEFASRMGRGESPPDPAGVVDFTHTHFESAVIFDDFLCAGKVDFRSATFSDSACFRSARFLGDIDFSSATFSGYTAFKSAKFAGDATFADTKFARNTVFAHVGFETRVPDFRGAEMHDAMEWDEITWPPAPRNKNEAQAQVYAYERLKREMELLKKHEDEQSFFRKELRARRGLARLGSWAWLLNYGYEASSDYGQSVGRPLIWLFDLFAIGFAVFALAPILSGAPMAMELAAEFSFANIFSFLPIRHEILTAPMLEHLAPEAQIVGAVQSLVGTLLLFLLGLALRNRFRMR